MKTLATCVLLLLLFASCGSNTARKKISKEHNSPYKQHVGKNDHYQHQMVKSVHKDS